MSQLFRDYDIDGCLGLVLIDIESNTSQIVLKLNPIKLASPCCDALSFPKPIIF